MDAGAGALVVGPWDSWAGPWLGAARLPRLCRRRGAGVWRSVAVNGGRGENLLFLRMDRQRRTRSLFEGVVAALIALRVAPGETLILGSSGGGALVSPS